MLMVSLPGYFFTICFVVKSQVVCQLIARIIINVNICIEAVNIFQAGFVSFITGLHSGVRQISYVISAKDS